MELDLHSIYPHHDLLVEVAKVEMAMERLANAAANERSQRAPVLESRLTDLRHALVQLAA